MPRTLSLPQIEQARAHRWRTAPERRVRTEADALRFIKEQGFVILMPVAGAELPTIHTACGGSWGAWWDWKQTLPERRACYYTHWLRRRGTFLSWEWFPACYAAFGPGKTYHQLFRAGQLSQAEKRILDLLSERGPMMTGDLRVAYAPRSKENTREVKSALVELQRRFLICAAGGSTAGWSHHRWDLVERWAPPELLFSARGMAPEEAKLRLTRQFLRNVLATTLADVAWFFGWERAEVKPALTHLLEVGEAKTVHVPELEGDVIVPKPWPRR